MRCGECGAAVEVRGLPFHLAGALPAERPESILAEARETLVARLRELRLRVGYSQREIAERVGVRREVLARWEVGHEDRTPGHRSTRAIRRVLLELQAEVPR